MSGENLPVPHDPFDEATYRNALQTLGLPSNADRDAIQQAYRDKAKRFHPDRFQDETQRAEATRRTQEVNVAYNYASQHWKGHQLARRWGGDSPARLGDAPWHEYLLVPVMAVYALATFAVAAPFLLMGRIAGARARARMLENGAAGFAWRVWVLAAPHVVTIALFASVQELAIRALLGASCLVMVSADVATLATGDPHTLRRPIQARLPKLR